MHLYRFTSFYKVPFTQLTSSANRAFLRSEVKFALTQAEVTHYSKEPQSINTMPNEQAHGSNSTTQPRSSFVKQETIHKAKWLSLEQVTYQDASGRQRTWEVVERTTKSTVPGVADAVAMVTVLKRLLHYDCVVLVKQYRPALKCYTIEFPAGLIDKGESPSEAAIRELKEETGYTATVQSVSPVVALDSGMSASTINLVHMQIDGDDPLNTRPSPHLDDGEFIEVILLPYHKLCEKLQDLAGKDTVIDARVYTYAATLQQFDTTKKKPSSQ